MGEFEPLIRMDQKHNELLAKLLAVSFADDPLTILQTKNLNNKEDFLIKLFREQLEIYSKTRDVFLLDEGCMSVLIGCERKRLKILKEFFLGIKAGGRIKKQLEKPDLNTYANNLKIAAGAVDLNWFKPLNLRNFYHINVIAVDKTEKGKGRFRALLSPIFYYCNKHNLPIILETVNPNNVPLFEHIGFKLVRKIEDRKEGIIQYCFILMPKP